MQLSNEERETIITFDETPNDAIILTHNKSWQKHIEQRLEIKPTMVNGYGGKEYQVPKKRIRMPLAPRKLSAEQRKKLGQRLSEARLQKSPNSSGNNVTTMKSQGEKSSEGKTTARQKKETK